MTTVEINRKSPRFLLDTNILVAAARSKNGASFALMSALARNEFIAIASVPVFLEYEAVLLRPLQLEAAQRTAEQVNAFLDALCKVIEPVHLHYLWRPQTRDPADEMILEAALNGSADAIVTLNPKDFTAAQSFFLPILSPYEALVKINRQHQKPY